MANTVKIKLTREQRDLVLAKQRDLMVANNALMRWWGDYQTERVKGMMIANQVGVAAWRATAPHRFRGLSIFKPQAGF